MKKSSYVSEYIKKFPDAANGTLANILIRDLPEIFTDKEATRSSIRYVRGSLGVQARKKRKIKESEKKYSKHKGFNGVPEGLKEINDWKIVNLRLKKTLVLSDVHIPYHSKKALIAALNYGKENGCKDVLLLGDFIDFFSVSYFQKDPRKRNLQNELDTYYKIMDLIRYNFSGRIIYKIGNHEERYNTFMQLRAPELLGVNDFSLSKILRFNHYNITPIYDKKPVKINNNLTALHGHEFAKSVFSPVNPARGLFLRSKTTTICGHYHQTSNHTETDLNGKIISCWSVGCLCNLHPKWMPVNKWGHGFSIIDNKNDDFFAIDNKKIIKGIIT
jgi:predicted phosphodiesterase